MGPITMIENPFLQGLTAEQFDLLVTHFAPVEIPAHATIFHQGQRATYMYLLIHGEVSIRYKPYDGPRMRLTRLHVGDVFGWSSVVGNATYASDAIATARARALRACGSEIRNLCAQHPTTGAQILEKLAAAVAPRWSDSQAQVQRLLERTMLESAAQPPADKKG
jgi:CRP/FNR family transcriptional regulator, cyclic AMP receptor protein